MSIVSQLSLSDAVKLLNDADLTPTLRDEQLQTISSYFELRHEWSTTHNLAGPKARLEPWRIDLIDAYALSHMVDKGGPLVDVGTGSGTPGLLVACLNSDIEVILIEPLAKRTAFLRQAVSKLGLTNVSVRRGRWPMNVSHETYQIVSRAVVAPDKWPDLATNTAVVPTTVFRMLAHLRPEWPNETHILTDVKTYRVACDQERTIEKWRLKCKG